MGVLNAVIELLDYRQNHPDCDFATASAALRGATSRFAGFDFNAAEELLEERPHLRELQGDGRAERLRLLLMHLLRDLRPGWLRVVPNGRRYLRTLIDGSNACQCLDCAGLFDKNLSPPVLEW